MSAVVFEPQNNNATDPIVLPLGQEVTLGDSYIADYSFPQSGMEDMHCRVISQTFGCFIECFSTKVTIEVNGTPVNRMRLKDGDMVLLGNLKFQFRTDFDLADSSPTTEVKISSQSDPENADSQFSDSVKGRAEVGSATVTESKEDQNQAEDVPVPATTSAENTARPEPRLEVVDQGGELPEPASVDPDEDTAIHETTIKSETVADSPRQDSTEEPGTEETGTEEPKPDEHETEGPKTEGPKAEEPKAEEPKSEPPKIEASKPKENRQSALCLNAVVWNHSFEVKGFQQGIADLSSDSRFHGIKSSMAGLEIQTLKTEDLRQIQELGMVAVSDLEAQEITQAIARWAPYFRSEALFLKFIGMAPKVVCQRIFDSVKIFLFPDRRDEEVVRGLSIIPRDEALDELGLKPESSNAD